MKRKPRSLGSFLLILGLVIYQFGLLATFHQTVLIGYVLNVLPNIQLVELMGVLLQLLEGFLIVAGFTSLVSGIVAVQFENEMRNLGYKILSRVDERANNMIARQRLNMVRKPIKRLRFANSVRHSLVLKTFSVNTAENHRNKLYGRCFMPFAYLYHGR